MTSESEKTTMGRKILKALIPVLLIIAGGAAWAYFQSTAPRIERKPKGKPATLVDVMTIQKGDATPVIKALGTVVPSREIVLKARVSGEVRHLSPRFVPGGTIAKGEIILQLDNADYEVQLKKAESALAKARGNLALEEGNQTIAREEMRLLTEASGEEISVTDLAMRKPQLMQAQAEIASAEADLLKARLDMGRTKVRAPFNCLVVARNVDLGSHVSTQDSLATLVSVDEYWVEAAVPVDRLSILELGSDSSYPAVVRSQAGGGQWQGKVLMTTGTLSQKTRMATLIVQVKDPLGMRSKTASAPMMLNDYVSVEITGKTLSGVMRLPRDTLRDKQTVWVSSNGRLEIRPVDIVWKQDDQVFVRQGLQPGEQVIVSNLSTVVQGMKISTGETAEKRKKTATKDATNNEG